MKFGQVPDPSIIDFTLPKDHPENARILSKNKKGLQNVEIAWPKWSRADLKGFYPRGTKDELTYYSTQFRAIELNATFYGRPTPEQIIKWRDKTPENFRFFPKITNSISHYKRLINVTDTVTHFLTAVLHFDEKLGMVFLQMHDNFKPKDYDRVEKFVKDWPREIPLAIELRNAEWIEDTVAFDKICKLFEDHNITNILVDTPGRRDLLHMRLTTSTAFIRFVSANSEKEEDRLDKWLERLDVWKKQGLENLYFFVHENIEVTSSLIAAPFIKKVNRKWGQSLPIPVLSHDAKSLS